MSIESKALLRDHPAIDFHADTFMWTRWTGYDVHKRHTPPLPKAAFGGHVDIPRMREGGVGAQFFSLVSIPAFGRTRGLARAIHEQIDAVEEAIARRPALRLVRTEGEVETARRDGMIGALLGIEGAHALEGDIDNIGVFASRGVRYLGLLHFSDNEVGSPAYGKGSDRDAGLKPFGRDVIARCEERSVIIDLAHINKKGFMEACAISHKPVIVSHTGVLGAFEHWRNIDDEQLRAVANKGGCVGVIFCPRYLGGDGLEPVVKHMKHILDTVGEDCCALGSDWDGFIIPTTPLRDPTGLPDLVDAMLAAGMSQRVLVKILRDNARRVLRETSAR